MGGFEGSTPPWRIRYILMTVGILGVIALFVLNAQRVHHHFEVVYDEEVMHMQWEVANFHLWLEEYLSGDESVDMEEAWAMLASARGRIDSVLDGVEKGAGRSLPPISQSDLRQEASALKVLLVDLESAAKDRMSEAEVAGAGTRLDQHFDAIYREVHLRSKTLGARLDKRIDASNTYSRRAFYLILLLWVLSVVLAILGIDAIERRRAMVAADRELIIGDLEGALDNVKTLSGLLPICGYCKKIRDDKGYWRKVENYIGDHSDAKFTHGICDDCAKKFMESSN